MLPYEVLQQNLEQALKQNDARTLENIIEKKYPLTETFLIKAIRRIDFQLDHSIIDYIISEFDKSAVIRILILRLVDLGNIDNILYVIEKSKDYKIPLHRALINYESSYINGYDEHTFIRYKIILLTIVNYLEDKTTINEFINDPLTIHYEQDEYAINDAISYIAFRLLSTYNNDNNDSNNRNVYNSASEMNLRFILDVSIRCSAPPVFIESLMRLVPNYIPGNNVVPLIEPNDYVSLFSDDV